MADAHKNLAVSTVATAPSPAASGTSLVVASGHGARFPAVPFNATVWPDGELPDPSNAEIVRVTNISSDTLTITRAQEDTTARTIVVGDLIAATITAKTLTDVEDALANHLADTADAHDASAISNVPAGGISATDVQAAIQELDSEKAAVSHAHSGADITSGTVADARIASTIARDSEVTAAISASEAGQVRDGDAAGGVLSGTYPDPGFAADMATQAELDAHVNDTTAAHAASAISFTPNGSIASTDVQAAIQEVRDEAAGGGAPSTADYLVGTAQGGLSAEIVVGTSPGGELGGTWASPTVDTVHSGSSHAAVQSAAEATAQAALDTHLNDTSDAHDASAISIADVAGDFTATDVEGALAELQSDAETDATNLANHLADATAAHAASAISYAGGTGMSATDVEAAVDELATEKANAADVPTNATFNSHASRHVDGGADEISIQGLAGTPVELTNHLNDTADAHDASAISILDSAGDFTATDVEAALAELQSEKTTAAAALSAAQTEIADQKRVIELLVTDPNGDAITTGDGKAYCRIPSIMNGHNLVEVAAAVTTVSSSGTPTIQINNVTQTADMLTTKITIDANEKDSSTAATAAVIDTANDDVATGDQLRVDVDVAGTGAKGLIVSMTFEAP